MIRRRVDLKQIARFGRRSSERLQAMGPASARARASAGRPADQLTDIESD
jgi:hypothetical protein